MSQKLREENKRLRADLKLANETIKMLQESINEAIDGIKKIREADAK